MKPKNFESPVSLKEERGRDAASQRNPAAPRAATLRGQATRFEVQKSRVHGYGLFSKTKISKGTRIIEYAGRKITKTEGDRLVEEGNVFVFELSDRFDLDGNIESNPARFINHSCDPNCEVDQRSNRIFIKSIRPIKPGEEISFNYGYDEKEKRPCNCGASNCSGFILAISAPDGGDSGVSASLAPSEK